MKKFIAALGVAILLAVGLAPATLAGYSDEDEINTGYPFLPTIHDQRGSTPGTVKLTRNLFWGDLYDDLKITVHWEGRALGYHGDRKISTGGTVEWPADQLEFELEVGACRNNIGYIVYRLEMSYGNGNVINWPGIGGWVNELGTAWQFWQKWEGAYAHLQSECYDHPADIPLDNNNVFQVVYRDWRPRQIDAFLSPTNSLPTNYDLEVQLVEYERWADPGAYRTRVITHNESVFQVTFFYADEHNLENLQMYVVRVRAVDPDDGRVGPWSGWKQIYYYGFDRYWLHSLLPGRVPLLTLPEEDPASHPDYVDPIVQPFEPTAEMIERAEQAIADAEAADSQPEIAPAPGEEYEDLEEIERRQREEEEDDCECAIALPIEWN